MRAVILGALLLATFAVRHLADGEWLVATIESAIIAGLSAVAVWRTRRRHT